MPKRELEKAIEIAGEYSTLEELGRAVNEELGLTWSSGTWRGVWKRCPREREIIRKVQRESVRSGSAHTITVIGDCRGAMLSDIHVPFHDYLSILLACAVLRWWKPDVCILGGDILDFYQLSSYDKNPERGFGIQDEIDTFHTDVLAPLSGVLSSRVRKIYFPGNHEDRLRKYMWRNPDLFDVRSLQLSSLLELDRYGWEYVESRVRFGNLLEVSHGVRVGKWSGAAARAEAEQRRYSITTITGHVHKAGHFGTNVPDPHGRRYISGYSNPCLCSLAPEYMTDPDWVNGITLFEIKNNKLDVHQVIFHPDHTCSVGGRWFRVESNA